MSFWADKRVLVTGGRGFLGTQVVRQLRNRGCAKVFAPRRSEYDLVEPDSVRSLLADTAPDLIFHLAARVGGIGANRENPGLFFYENLVMGVHLMEEARRQGVGKFVAVGTVCAYPKHVPVPF